MTPTTRPTTHLLYSVKVLLLLDDATPGAEAVVAVEAPAHELVLLEALLAP